MSRHCCLPAFSAAALLFDSAFAWFPTATHCWFIKVHCRLDSGSCNKRDGATLATLRHYIFFRLGEIFFSLFFWGVGGLGGRNE